MPEIITYTPPPMPILDAYAKDGVWFFLPIVQKPVSLPAPPRLLN